VHEIAAAIEIRDTVPQLDQDNFSEICRLVKQTIVSERPTVLADLIALAIEIQTRVGGSAALLVAQLCVIAGGLMEDMEAATYAFQKVGALETATKKLLALDSGASVPRQSSVSDPHSLFSMLLNRKP